MSHYDHIAYVSLKLGRWSDPKPFKNWEQEREDAHQNALDVSAEPTGKPSGPIWALVQYFARRSQRLGLLGFGGATQSK